MNKKEVDIMVHVRKIVAYIHESKLDIDTLPLWQRRLLGIPIEVKFKK